MAFLDETLAAQIALLWLVPGEVRRRGRTVCDEQHRKHFSRRKGRSSGRGEKDNKPNEFSTYSCANKKLFRSAKE
jgi:hypothetical protein